MAATAAQIARVRRLVDEPSTTTYSDIAIGEYIESYPLMDERGEVPYTWDTSTSPPTQDTNDNWIATYDIHAAAADIWEEKAAGVAEDYDYRADGGQFTRSQVYEQYMSKVRYHRSRRAAGTITAHKWPEETTSGGVDTTPWIINNPEPDDE